MSQLFRQIIVAELEDLANRISENIRKNGQWASGDTARSLKLDARADEYTLYGRGDFQNLEKGYKGYVSARTIFNWMVAKGIAKPDPEDTLKWAFRVADKIQEEGTILYRTGRTFDGIVPRVYSDEIRETVARLTDKLGAYVADSIETIVLNSFGDDTDSPDDDAVGFEISSDYDFMFDN